MTRIGLLFELRSAETRPGEVIRVVGDHPELGAWNPFDDTGRYPLELRTGSTSYPCWGMLTPVWIDLTPGEGAHLSWSMSDDPSSDVASSAPTTPRTLLPPCEASSPARGITVDVDLAASSSSSEPVVNIEYKYVKDKQKLGHGGPSIEWEDRIGNRRIALPQESGAIWLVSDTTWNSSEPPRISRESLPEVVKRWEHLDPEWTSREHERGGPEWSEGDRDAGDSGSLRSEMTGTSTHTTSTVGPFRVPFVKAST